MIFGNVKPLALPSVSYAANSIISGITSFLSLDYWYKVQHDFSDHAMSLVLASVSCDAGDVINGNITFLRSMMI